MEKFIKQLEEMGFKDVKFQMHDCHAWYFDAHDTEVNQPAEIKIEKEDKWSYFRLEGNEDWSMMDEME